ncbi:MAG TPA: hypothetical protein P5571_00300 [Candidatus Krumholzibacteria bacterium]|nr:hypothetical protein [Candidatus Krumholzibacteria bacterium]HRX49796.1 hypothetical protein [Candidatus Krumholzibacteria bacterium]
MTIWWVVVGWLLVVSSTLGRVLVRRLVRDLPGAPRDAGTGRAGALVGVLERLLIIAMILVGEWAVIGFVIAAKSIARFDELKDKNFTDYYLAGTFGSLLVAVACGLLGLLARHLLQG